MARRLIPAAAAAALLLLVSPASVAAAPVGSPPVTQPDTVKLRAQSADVVDVAANDTDPDGDEVRVCRVGDVPRQLQAEVVDGELGVYASEAGTFTLTYFACDTSYLTPGTLTVKVRGAAPTLDVIPTRRPGKLRIVNTFKGQTFHCEWREGHEDEPGPRPGHAEESKPDGSVVVRPRSSVVITVHHADIEIECESPRGGYGFGFSGLPLP